MAVRKKIKIKFVGFWQGDFSPDRTFIYRSLIQHYDVEIVTNNEIPNCVICSVFGQPYEYCKYPCVRIMYCGENYIPDFNLIDYGIANYPLTFQDRYFYFPFFIDEFGHCESLSSKDRNYSADILKQKEFFANFIAGHESEFSLRGDFFKELCKYKRVESPGTYLNNMPNGETVCWARDSKTEFQRKCKFSLCFESTKHEGFITEKITDAFYSDTIPVYYGSSHVVEIFNKDAFINVSDYGSFAKVIEKIKELDQDDEKYLKMLRQPIFVEEDYPQKKLAALDEYVQHIFDQPPQQIYRRSKVYSAANFDCFLSSLKIKRPSKFRNFIYFVYSSWCNVGIWKTIKKCLQKIKMTSHVFCKENKKYGLIRRD